MSAEELLDQVHDRESFFAFVRALIAERERAVESEKTDPTPYLGLVTDSEGWYNYSIEGYLEAALSWAETSDMGARQGLPVEPSWQAFATFLYCGKIYE